MADLSKEEIEQKLAKKVKFAKHTNVNFMTIPQIRNAKDILTKKLKTQELNPTTQAKLNQLLFDYEQAERSINKYYQAMESNTKTRGMRKGQRNLLTIAQIRKKENFKRDKDLKYNAVDFMNDIRADKIALGVGIASMSAGMLTAIKINGQSIMQMIGKFLKDFMLKNPASFALLASGAALIAASKIVPAVEKKAKLVRENKYKVNQMQNALSADSNEKEKSVDNLKLLDPGFDKSPAFEDLARQFMDNEALRDRYLNVVNGGKDPLIQLNTQQRVNVMKAIKRSIELPKEEIQARKDLKEAAKQAGYEVVENPGPVTEQKVVPATTTQEQATEAPATQTPEELFEDKKEEPVPAPTAGVAKLEQEMNDLLKLDGHNGNLKKMDNFINALDQAVAESKITPAEALRLKEAMQAHIKQMKIQNMQEGRAAAKAARDAAKAQEM